jgi:hypothetical protein
VSKAIFAGVLLVAVLLAPTGSSACACGEETRFVVAHGTSPNGAPWKIKVGEARAHGLRAARISFNYGSGGAAGTENGVTSSRPLPLPKAVVLNASAGSGVYPQKEGDVAGFARRRAVRLVAQMNDGSRIEIETVRPPAELEKRFPWLRGLAFFDQFYAADLEPLAINAYSRDGRLLGRWRSRPA